MYHTTLQAISGQLVFGSKIILNTLYISDGGAINKLKQKLIDKIINMKIKLAKRTVIKYMKKY